MRSQLANQQLLRRNALLTQNFDQLRMNIAVLKAKLEVKRPNRFNADVLSNYIFHASLLLKKKRSVPLRRFSERKPNGVTGAKQYQKEEA